MSADGRHAGAPTSIRPLFGDWARYQRAFVEGLRGRSAVELGARVGTEAGPVWAMAAHVAGARVFWLCGVFGEPGAETTPFADPFGEGWEDDLAHPRSADELVWAMESSWAVIDGCLDRWSPASLAEVAIRQSARGPQEHTRASVLARLITHDAFHAGEISLVLGSHGHRSMDLWAPPSALPPAVGG